MGIATGMDKFYTGIRMNHYEIGKHIPDYTALKQISKILKIPPAYFYTEDDQLAEIIKIFE